MISNFILQCQNRDEWPRVIFLQNNCLELFLVQSGSEYWVNQSYKRQMLNVNMYYVKHVTCHIYSIIFWKIFVVVKFNTQFPTSAYFPAHSLPVFQHHRKKYESTTTRQSDWKLNRFDFVRLVWQLVRHRTSCSLLLRPYIEVLLLREYHIRFPLRSAGQKVVIIHIMCNRSLNLNCSY